jgi:hypothetical protein
MGINRRRLERELARAREAQRRNDDEARQAEITEATAFIEAWNAMLAAGHRAPFSPTMGGAIIARYRWLTVQCPGCGMVSDIDLSTLDRHPHASIASLIPSLSCRTCRPHAPFARLVGLSRERPALRRHRA